MDDRAKTPMNPIGIYYAYWTRDWDADFHPFVDKVTNLGFDVLEVNAGTIARMSSEERKALKAHAEDRGLRLSYCVGLPPEYDVASESAAVRQAGIDFLRRMTNGIGEMGGGNLGGIIYGCWPASLPAGHPDRRPFVDRSLQSLREVIKAAEQNNVILCFEVVNRFEQFIMNTAEEGASYVEALDSSNAKLLLDTFHMNIEEPSLSSAVHSAGRHLGHVHIGENNRMPPGSGYGHLPWGEVATALRQVGYTGQVVMEPFVRPGGQVGRDIRVHRDLAHGKDLDQEAQKALEFLRQVLEPTEA